jgi:hypothetical protein
MNQLSKKYYILVLLLTILITKINSVQAITEGSLVVKMNQRFCLMLIYHDIKDTELNNSNIIAQSCSVVIEDKIDNVLKDNNHDEALIKINVEKLKDKLTKLDNLDENYFFNINYILIGCCNTIKATQNKQCIYENFFNTLDSALVTSGFIINYNNIVICNTDELLAQMALEFSNIKGGVNNKDNNNLLLLNAETGNNLNTECICIQTNGNKNNKINFITESRANIFQELFDKNISFLYHYNHAIDSNLLTKCENIPRLHLFNKPFNIYRVYQLTKHKVLDFILVQDYRCFDDNIYSLNKSHEIKAQDRLSKMNKKNLSCISEIINTNIDVLNIWATKNKADPIILIGELLLSNAVFSFYQQYLLQKLSKNIINKIYLTNKNDFYLALLLATKKIQTDANITSYNGLIYKTWKITASNQN